MLEGPCRYPEHVQKFHRKFFRRLWKKVSTKNMRSSRANFSLSWSWKTKKAWFPHPQHVFINIFWLKRYMTLIFFLNQSAKSSAPPRYLECCRKARGKSSEATWNKSCSSKHEVLSEYSTWLWASFFKNLNSFHFSWHIIGLVRRMITIFLLTQRTRLGGSPRYLKHYRKVCRKFSGATWKKLQQLKR